MDFLQHRLADVRLDVPVLAIKLDDALGVFLELVFLIHACVLEDEEAPSFVLLHLSLEIAVAVDLVADEGHIGNLYLRSFGDLEGQVDGFLRALQLLNDGIDFRVLIALVDQHFAHGVAHARVGGRVDERIEPDGFTEHGGVPLERRRPETIGQYHGARGIGAIIVRV